MSDSTIKPERITKPIQLLSAWLIGLVLVNGSFLSTAITLEDPVWLRGVLIVACVVNVPVFLMCLFLLQTKFRPQMQEDSYYAKYLENNTGEILLRNPERDGIDKLRQELLAWEERYVALASGLEVSLKNIASDVAKRHETQSQNNGSTGSASELEASISAVEHQLAQLSQLNYEAQINDLLPDYESIREELEASEIEIQRTFGSSSKIPEVPERKIVGFGSGTSIEALRRVVTVCEKYGFNEIHWASQEHNKFQIYIGSYIYRAPGSPQPVDLTQVKKVLFDPKSSTDSVIARIKNLRKLRQAILTK